MGYGIWYMGYGYENKMNYLLPLHVKLTRQGVCVCVCVDLGTGGIHKNPFFSRRGVPAIVPHMAFNTFLAISCNFCVTTAATTE